MSSDVRDMPLPDLWQALRETERFAGVESLGARILRDAIVGWRERHGFATSAAGLAQPHDHLESGVSRG